MLRKILICSVLILSSIAIASSANLVGKWKTTIAGPQGNMEMTILVKSVAADTISGAFVTSMGEIPIINGKIKGDTFSFDLSAGQRKMHYECTFTDEKITMKSPGRNGGEDRTVIFDRVKE